jgi:hypothetical protein
MWNEKMVPLRKEKGKKIVGPGCASDPRGEAWLDEFMKRVREMEEPPDYLALHYYGPDGAAAIQYIEKMYVSAFFFHPGDVIDNKKASEISRIPSRGL